MVTPCMCITDRPYKRFMQSPSFKECVPQDLPRIWNLAEHVDCFALDSLETLFYKAQEQHTQYYLIAIRHLAPIDNCSVNFKISDAIQWVFYIRNSFVQEHSQEPFQLKETFRKFQVICPETKRSVLNTYYFFIPCFRYINSSLTPIKLHSRISGYFFNKNHFFLNSFELAISSCNYDNQEMQKKTQQFIALHLAAAYKNTECVALMSVKKNLKVLDHHIFLLGQLYLEIRYWLSCSLRSNSLFFPEAIFSSSTHGKTLLELGKRIKENKNFIKIKNVINNFL